MNKSWLKQDALPFIIITKPTKKNVITFFDEGGGINDEELKLVLSGKGSSGPAFVTCIIGFLTILVATIISVFDKNSKFIDWLDVILPIFIIAFLFWLYSFIKPTKILTLQRFKGIMTYPSYGFYPHFTITFTRAKLYRSLNSIPEGASSIAGIKFKNLFIPKITSIIP